MVKQYPHYLFAVIGGEAVQNDDGDWVESSEPAVKFISVCREETNGKGSQIQIAGGTFHVFASLIQLPKDALSVDVGTTVFVANDDAGINVRVKGIALKFDSGQLHSRLWV